MKEHEETREKLSSYLDNALGVQEKEAVRVHLGRCGGCRGLLADLEWAAQQVKRLPVVEPPPWLMPQIMGRIKEEPVVAVPEKFLVPFKVKLLLGLALLVLIGLGIGLMWEGKERKVSPPTVPQTAAKPAAPLAATPPASVVGRAARTAPARPVLPLPKSYRPAVVLPSAPPPPVTSPLAEPVVVPVSPEREMPELQPADEWVIPDKEK